MLWFKCYLLISKIKASCLCFIWPPGLIKKKREFVWVLVSGNFIWCIPEITNDQKSSLSPKACSTAGHGPQRRLVSHQTHWDRSSNRGMPSFLPSHPHPMAAPRRRHLAAQGISRQWLLPSSWSCIRPQGTKQLHGPAHSLASQPSSPQNLQVHWYN